MSEEQQVVLGIIVFVFIFILGTNFYSSYTLRKRIKKDWGKLPTTKRFDKEESLKASYEKVKEYRLKESEIDDITWHDLDMFSIFTELNHTYSSIGSEALYQRLRLFSFDQTEQQKLEQLIQYLKEHPSIREKIEYTFATLGKKDNNFVVDYLLEGQEKRLNHLAFYILLGLLPFLTLASFFAGWNYGLFLFICSILFNIVYYQSKKIALDVQLTSMGYLVQTIATAKKLTKINQPLKEPIQQTVHPLKSVLKFGFSFRMKTNSEAEFLFDYLNMMLMLPFISYHFVLNRLAKHHDSAFIMWESLGQLEVACAILNYRTAHPNYCLPTFKEGTATGEQIAHPLLEEPVTNPLNWTRNTLVTGSNASGKSTYVKAVAINCILAQTIHTCTARSFSLEPGHVLTSMAVQDDIFEGDSYFVAEIKSLKRVLKQSNTHQRCYLFIDEILKGTNTIERIAASASIVKWLSNTSSLAFIATHDIELTTILEKHCDNVHFQEQVTKDQGIYFDYLLKEGPSTSKNALKLLEVMDYPNEVIQTATASAQIFAQTEQWEPL
jgi:DNA mismatch repair ATPase MutS